MPATWVKWVVSWRVVVAWSWAWQVPVTAGRALKYSGQLTMKLPDGSV